MDVEGARVRRVPEVEKGRILGGALLLVKASESRS